MITSPNETALVDVHDGICWVTFNRPDSLNALNPDIVAALKGITDQLMDAPAVRAVVLQGAGDHFMAGGDIKTFEDILTQTTDAPEIAEVFEGRLDRVHEVIRNIRALPQPVIASVKGAAAGAGFSLMLACDLVIAADTSVFTLAYCKLGTSPDGGSTYFMPRMAGLKTAMELALLGDRFDAETAKGHGLINFIVSADSLGDETRKLAARLAFGPSRAYAETKAALNGSLSRTLDDQLDAETQHFVTCAQTKDFKEGVMAFVGKRKPDFNGQ